MRTVLGSDSFAEHRIRAGVGASMALDADIVGVVADAKYRSLRSPVPPTLYVSMAQDPTPPPGIVVAVRVKVWSPRQNRRCGSE